MMKRFISNIFPRGEDKQALIQPVDRASDVGPTEDGVHTGGAGREPDTLYKTFQHSHPIFRAPDEPVADPHLESLVELDRPPQSSAPSQIPSTTLADKYPTLFLAPGDVVEATPGSETDAALGSHPSSSTSREQHLVDETPLCFRARDGQTSDRALSRGLIPCQPPEVPRGDVDFCRNDQQSKMEREKDSWSNGKGPDTSPYTSKTEILTDGGANGPNGRPGSRQFVYLLACFATIGGLLFGYDTGIVSGSMLTIKPRFNLNTVWQEIIVSGTIAAAAVFSLVSGVVCDLLGRRVTIMAASFIFTAGAVVMAASPSKEVLLVGRIVVGAGIGFASMTVPVYVAEAAPPDIRGRLVTLNQLFITIGILISSIIAGAFHEVDDGWRYMLGLAGIPGVIQFVGFIFLPESPRWLISKGRTEDARKVLQRIRSNDDNIDDEIKEVAEAESNSQTGFVLGEILRTPHVRKALFIGSGLQLFQQLCGINTVIYYSASILKLAGFPSDMAIWLVCVPNVVNFLSTFIGVWAVERFGRKRLLVISFLGVVVALVVLAVGFQLSAIHSPPVNITSSSVGHNDSCATSYDVCENCILNADCGYCYDENDLPSATCAHAIEDDEEHALYGGCSINKTSSQSGLKWAHGYCPTDYTWMAVLGLALFVFSFAPGLGPMPWTINSEIYPMWARGTGNAIATAVNWIFNLIVSFTFLTMTENITKHGTFWLFGGICFLGMIFTLIFVPETKNKSLEEVEELFMSASERKNRQRQREIKNNIVVEEKPAMNVTNTRL